MNNCDADKKRELFYLLSSACPLEDTHDVANPEDLEALMNEQHSDDEVMPPPAKMSTFELQPS